MFYKHKNTNKFFLLIYSLVFPKDTGSTKEVYFPPFSKVTYQWVVEWQKSLVFTATLMFNQVLTALQYLHDPELVTGAVPVQSVAAL